MNVIDPSGGNRRSLALMIKTAATPEDERPVPAHQYQHRNELTRHLERKALATLRPYLYGV